MKTIITLDSSQLAAFSKCPRMWQYSYKERLSSPFQKKKAADKGTLIHLMLQIYYQILTLQPTVNKMQIAGEVIKLFDTLVDLKKYDVDAEELKFLKLRFTQYVIQYQNNDFRVLSKAGKASVEIGFSKILYEDDFVVYVVEGRLDFLCEMNGIIMWGDHKTQAQAKTLYKYKPQFLTYSWATGLSRGMINYVGLQKEVEQRSMRREVMYFPAWKLEEWKTQIMDIFNAIHHTRNFDILEQKKDLSACGGAWDSSPCQFTNLCETQEKGLIENMKKNFYITREKWTPWQIEEVS